VTQFRLLPVYRQCAYVKVIIHSGGSLAPMPSVFLLLYQCCCCCLRGSMDPYFCNKLGTDVTLTLCSHVPNSLETTTTTEQHRKQTGVAVVQPPAEHHAAPISSTAPPACASGTDRDPGAHYRGGVTAKSRSAPLSASHSTTVGGARAANNKASGAADLESSAAAIDVFATAHTGGTGGRRSNCVVS
jgi:hypothetical protein